MLTRSTTLPLFRVPLQQPYSSTQPPHILIERLSPLAFRSKLVLAFSARAKLTELVPSLVTLDVSIGKCRD